MTFISFDMLSKYKEQVLKHKLTLSTNTNM